MLQACMNDAGPVLTKIRGKMVQTVDPFYNKQYSQFCYVFQYMPGGTTYLDTPIVPVSAFASNGNVLDCAAEDSTPLIASAVNASAVDGVPAEHGPYLNINVNTTLLIRSAGKVDVPNPDFDPTRNANGGNPTVTSRDFGFGNRAGSVQLINLATGIVRSVTPANRDWSDGEITLSLPTAVINEVNANGVQDYQLMVTTRSGAESPRGVVLTVASNADPIAVHAVSASAAPLATPIQDAIDNAAAGDLVLVAAGFYNELPILHKPLRLQAAGPDAFLNGRKAPTTKLQFWRTHLDELLAAGQFDLLPGQEPNPVGAGAAVEPLLFFDAEGAGITVAGNVGEFDVDLGQRIDGFTIAGADHGGGIFVNGHAANLRISNNVIESNQGTYGGGIRLGNTSVLRGGTDGLPVDADNDNILIRNNHIALNGNFNGAGAGVSTYRGADNYAVSDNFICGNFASTHGGGIGHMGLSDGGLIEGNQIVFNQSFLQGLPVDGGGLFIGGDAPLAGQTTSPGAGNVSIIGNLIQGNNAGAGDGGGIAMDRVNGDDVIANPDDASQWFQVDVINNMIVNNVAGLAGGGITLRDSLRTVVVNNTIANNDSSATAGLAFTAGVPERSNAQPAGVVAREHVTLLDGAGDVRVGAGVAARYQASFSNPVLENNILWGNRSFLFEVNAAHLPGDLTTPPFLLTEQTLAEGDLAVLPAGIGALSPVASVFSAGYAGAGVGVDGNLLATAAQIDFLNPIANYGPGLSQQMPETTVQLGAAAAFDEGGNFIDVRYAPLSLGTSGDYHLAAGSVAIDAGVTGGAVPSVDYDNELRNDGAQDIGADEAM
jgi:hypothetical protein